MAVISYGAVQENVAPVAETKNTNAVTSLKVAGSILMGLMAAALVAAMVASQQVLFFPSPSISSGAIGQPQRPTRGATIYCGLQTIGSWSRSWVASFRGSLLQRWQTRVVGLHWKQPEAERHVVCLGLTCVCLRSCCVLCDCRRPRPISSLSSRASPSSR